MTGNTRVWRAPLAGLAAVAMLATMGVAASTANAADHDVTVNGTTVNVWTGESVEEAVARHGATPLNYAYGYTVDGKAYNPATPVSGSVDLKKAPTGDTVPVKFKLSAEPGSAQVFNGTVESTDYTVYVPKGAALKDYFDVKDAANGKKVTKWELKDSGKVASDVDTLDEVLSYGVASATSIEVTPVTVKPAATIEFTRPANWNNNAHYVGSWTDKAAPAAGETLTLDGLKGETLDAPTYVYTDAPVNEFDKVASWVDGDGNTVELGGKFTVDGDATYEPADKNAGADVTFDSNGGSYVKPAHIDAYGHVAKPADPTRSGYTFGGWALPSDATAYTAENGAVGYAPGSTTTIIVLDFGGVTFNRNVTLTALWTPTYDIRVTFHYGDYEGAPKDVTATYKPSDFLTEPETPTRAGYVFDGWRKPGATPGSLNEFFDFNNTLVANGATSENTNFVLTGVWHRAYADEALNALKYVQVKEYKNDGLGRDDSGFFTGDSWKAFSAEYKKAYQKYESAKHNAVNGEIDSNTAADVVNTLQSAWKGLRFSTADADGTLDGHNKGGHAKVIYRLYNPTSGEHLFTGDEHEVKTLTNKYVGQGGWTLDQTTFKSVANAEAAWVANTQANKDAGSFSPLVNEVKRYAGAREHLYTSDPAEQASLKQGGWSLDSAKASILVPALYTTSTKVVRLYDPAADLHLYSSKKSEVSFWLARGLSQDSDKASFYAL